MRLLLTALLCLLTLPTHAAGNLTAGTDYIELSPPRPIRVPAGKIEVREFFNYSCPHCFRLQGHLAKWLAQNQQDDIVLVHQPVVFQRYNGHFARVYYTIQALKLEKELHSEVYDALHVQRQLINSKGRFLDWLEEDHQIDRDRAEKVYDSFTVQTRARLANDIAADFGVDSTPQLAVNGKYIINPGLSRSYENLMTHLTELVEHERQARQ